MSAITPRSGPVRRITARKTVYQVSLDIVLMYPGYSNLSQPCNASREAGIGLTWCADAQVSTCASRADTLVDDKPGGDTVFLAGLDALG